MGKVIQGGWGTNRPVLPQHVNAVVSTSNGLGKMPNDQATDTYIIKDSGARAQFASGMTRDTSNNKVRYNRVLEGPMFKRWAAHLHKGAIKYPDVAPGVANWTLANSPEELQRFKESFLGHAISWLDGEMDEDHAAAIIFNLNGAELVKEKLRNGQTEPVRLADVER